MWWVRNSILAGLAGLLACMGAGAASAGLLDPVEHNRLIKLLDHKPMVFFVARGPADSCGKGCNEWIAAVGSFDDAAPQRFRALLEKLGGRNLPVYFHSPGGLSGSGMRIGTILRERRMTAAVGRTEATCRVFDKKDTACQARIAAGEPLSARLRVTDASCFSACVEAFAGAASRRIAAEAHLGVHQARMGGSQKEMQILGAPQVKPRVTSMAEFLRLARMYYVEMGVSPDLPDFASKISHQRIYILHLGEIERFGLETRGDSYTTPWVMTQLPSIGSMVTKSITQRDPNSTETLTTRFSFICSDRQAIFGYRRDLPRDPGQAKALTRLSFDQAFVDFRVINTAGGAETGAFNSILHRDTLDKFAKAKNLVVSEKMKTADQKVVQSSFSNAGLETALMEFQKRCMPDLPKEAPGSDLTSPTKPAAIKTVPIKREPIKPTPVRSVPTKPTPADVMRDVG